MSEKLGICVVGCGYMGRIHAERWANIPSAEIVAVADLDEVRADKLANHLNLDCYYKDYLDAIALPEVDVVSICTPTHLHAQVTVEAAELGKHILCEKPIALTLADADQMIAAAKANNVKLGLGFMRRHSAVVRDLKDLLAAGKFGRPVLYNASDVRELRPKREMHDARVNGGPVIDMAVHLIDLWTTIFDSRPVSVSAQGLKIAQDRPEIDHIKAVAVDTATVLVKYISGDIGTFTVTWGLPPKVTPPSHNDLFFGPKGLGAAYYAGNKQELRLMRENGAWETVAISHEDMYQNQAASFAKWITDDEPFPATGEEGKSALRVALAALESIQSGKTIQL
ncbi:MAG: Gfo/Idh/MocA family oxidoreductase [Anaerolineales bacterium]|nr:Gfo/Idh/MocA family oxidoreductase [Anaerolineales bacterium]